MRRFLHRISLLALVVPLALALSLASGGTALAINPPQTTENGVVYYLGRDLPGGIDAFWSAQFRAWGRPYARPGLYWLTAPRYCNGHLMQMNNSFYCPADQTIWLDYNWNQNLINRYGDNGGGVILAHEWGHRIQHLLGEQFGGAANELNADCLAGMYTRYGLATGRLVNGDFYEARSTVYSLGDYNYSSPDHHGTPQQRADWFTAGYSYYDINVCNRVFGSSPSTRGTAGFDRPLSAAAR
jgi:predicted metalloprotease